MSLLTTTASHVMVSKGFDNKPQVKFSAKDGSSYGSLTFKISHKKAPAKTGEKGEYDNYSITVKNVKSDSKIIDMLNQPGVKISLTGTLSQEEYEGKKFCRITCESSYALTIDDYGTQTEGSHAPAAQSHSTDEL